jgi:hypothetical protein
MNDHRDLSTQGLDDATGGNLPGAPKHDEEHLAVLVSTRPGLRVAVDDLQRLLAS